MIKKILHFLARLLLILLLTALVLGGILLYNLQMNKSFITTFYTVTVDKPVEDLRIVLLSDLHLSEYGTDNADLVQKVRNLAPDLIAVAGDMDIDTNPDYSLVLSLMRQLVDIAPVYYAPGNHEWAARYANGCDTIFDDIKATGVHWMNGTYEDAVINGKKLRIGGFFEWPRAQLERAIPGLFTDPACGRVLRVKGFVEEAGQWYELNATAEGLAVRPLEQGQQVLIVIGEGLDKAALEAVLRR